MENRDDKIAKVKEQLSKLENVDLESLSDEELESVAGGCSVWCCSHSEATELEAMDSTGTT